MKQAFQQFVNVTQDGLPRVMVFLTAVRTIIVVLIVHAKCIAAIQATLTFKSLALHTFFFWQTKMKLFGNR